MTSAADRLPEYPFAILSELRDAAGEHGYRIGPELAAGWIFFRSATAPAEIALGASGASGPFFMSVMHRGVGKALEARVTSPAARGHVAAFLFETLDELRAGVSAAYRLSVSLPNFPLEQYEAATQQLGETEGERVQKYRIGQDIFRDALMEFWGAACAVTGISHPELLRASHAKPWARCESNFERLDVFNGLLLSALWDAAFDSGFVTFGADGRAIPSPSLSEKARHELDIETVNHVRLRDEHQPYLEFHRAQIWRAN